MTPPFPIRILLVDDFEPWRKKLRSMLQDRANLQIVGEARTGREGIEETERLRPDLVLLDLALPDLNGIQVAERIHRIFPESKILVVTLNEDADLANEVVLRNEVRGYLLKSDVQEEFCQLSLMLSGASSLSASD
jgi:DNA-binding NarL/FixJ family response regulator